MDRRFSARGPSQGWHACRGSPVTVELARRKHAWPRRKGDASGGGHPSKLERHGEDYALFEGTSGRAGALALPLALPLSPAPLPLPPISFSLSVSRACSPALPPLGPPPSHILPPLRLPLLLPTPPPPGSEIQWWKRRSRGQEKPGKRERGIAEERWGERAGKGGQERGVEGERGGRGEPCALTHWGYTYGSSTHPSSAVPSGLSAHGLRH